MSFERARAKYIEKKTADIAVRISVGQMVPSGQSGPNSGLVIGALYPSKSKHPETPPGTEKIYGNEDTPSGSSTGLL